MNVDKYCQTFRVLIHVILFCIIYPHPTKVWSCDFLCRDRGSEVMYPRVLSCLRSRVHNQSSCRYFPNGYNLLMAVGLFFCLLICMWIYHMAGNWANGGRGVYVSLHARHGEHCFTNRICALRSICCKLRPSPENFLNEYNMKVILFLILQYCSLVDLGLHLNACLLTWYDACMISSWMHLK